MKGEKGNVIIEASFVLPIVGVILGILVYLSFLLYQNVMITAIANDTAVSIAQIYGVKYKDPFYGWMGSEEFYKMDLYRNLDYLHTESLSQINVKKGEWYSKYRLSKGRMLFGKDQNVEVEVGWKEKSFISRQIAVSITETYHVPLVSLFGVKDEITFSAMAYADCNDIIDYMNTTTFIKDKKDESNILEDLEFAKRWIFRWWRD